MNANAKHEAQRVCDAACIEARRVHAEAGRVYDEAGRVYDATVAEARRVYVEACDEAQRAYKATEAADFEPEEKE